MDITLTKLKASHYFQRQVFLLLSDVAPKLCRLPDRSSNAVVHKFSQVALCQKIRFHWSKWHIVGSNMLQFDSKDPTFIENKHLKNLPQMHASSPQTLLGKRRRRRGKINSISPCTARAPGNGHFLKMFCFAHLDVN